ncbi:hypothetical protein AAFF_G00119900 [Aldrovandia affinis]|uniref:Uncharacterized protein n=1 Tax=Aldrovandia affinis TaxID=143900 RepID=A0AAD7RSJ9_9TELE|nr:hypothetical protein AAFF_G00119900 [Aldrovandia affinis]
MDNRCNRGSVCQAELATSKVIRLCGNILVPGSNQSFTQLAALMAFQASRGHPRLWAGWLRRRGWTFADVKRRPCEQCDWLDWASKQHRKSFFVVS